MGRLGVWVGGGGFSGIWGGVCAASKEGPSEKGRPAEGGTSTRVQAHKQAHKHISTLFTHRHTQLHTDIDTDADTDTDTYTYTYTDTYTYA